jgi:hypothetical protein
LGEKVAWVYAFDGDNDESKIVRAGNRRARVLWWIRKVHATM